MNRKNAILLLIPILLTLAISFSFTLKKKQDPPARNIIFMIGDGMGLAQVSAAYTVNHGQLYMTRTPVVGLQLTHSADRYNTDSGAAATALACGVKTNNQFIGLDTARNEVESILKILEKRGMATGLVSTKAVTNATPAAFIANDTFRYNYEPIAMDFMDTDIDLFIGGGLDHFSKRKDGRDLTEELVNKGYTLALDMESVLQHSSGRLAALLAPEDLPKIIEGRGDMLPQATRKALELLDKGKNGFFIMIEGSKIDEGGHDNNIDVVLTETLDFDAAVKEALEFAEKDGQTLVVITADHETGGLTLLNGDYDKGTVKAVFSMGDHTGIMVPVFAFGPGAELFSGVYGNDTFKEKFIRALDLK